jgi:hypothetical protein
MFVNKLLFGAAEEYKIDIVIMHAFDNRVIGVFTEKPI